jgi:hypothetical protein
LTEKLKENELLVKMAKAGFDFLAIVNGNVLQSVDYMKGKVRAELITAEGSSDAIPQLSLFIPSPLFIYGSHLQSLH